ncbi:MAG: hypothetical protein QXJ75_02180 [Candidatus Bathyarchaeia archaeon]
MGGEKKKSLAQMERAQTQKAEQPQPKGGKSPQTKSYTSKVGKVDSESITREIMKMKVLTPSAVAMQLGVKVSQAKDILEGLVQQGIVELVSSSSRLKIYKAAPPM